MNEEQIFRAKQILRCMREKATQQNKAENKKEKDEWLKRKQIDQASFITYIASYLDGIKS